MKIEFSTCARYMRWRARWGETNIRPALKPDGRRGFAFSVDGKEMVISCERVLAVWRRDTIGLMASE